MSSPDLSDLDAFVAVARARSFRGAAGLRGVSASSLSDALRRLEARLGVRLLNRTTRSVTPTEAGERLLERLGPALGEIAGALDAVNSFRDSPTGTLRLNVPSIVARHILPPIACRFLLAHPGITLEVTAEDSFVDVLAGGFDAGIRYEERIERDMIAVPIGPRRQRFVVAAAPSYLAATGGRVIRATCWTMPASATASPAAGSPALGVRARRPGRPDQPGRAADRDRAGDGDRGRGRRAGRDLPVRGGAAAGSSTAARWCR